MLCSEWSLVKTASAETTIIPLRCKCWSCEECRPRRKSKLKYEAELGHPNMFITLTHVRRKDMSRHEAARALVKAWRRVRLEYIKDHGKHSLPFLCVFEETKKGWPHLHIVARAKWVDQVWLSRRMGALIGSPIVDVRRITNRRKVIAYIAKYLKKNPHLFRGVKRYWRSLDYFRPTSETDFKERDLPNEWQIVRCSYETLAKFYEVEGYIVECNRYQATVTPYKPP